MKYTLLCLLFSVSILLVSQETFCQEAEITDISRVTILPPGFSYEKKIARLQSLYGHVFATTNVSFGASSDQGFQFDVSIDPSALIQYRYYYNGDRRVARGKRTDMNSMNYLAPVFSTSLSRARIISENITSEKRRAVNNIGLVWGMQRNYEKRVSIDLNLGIDYLFTKGTTYDIYSNPITVNVHRVSPVVKLTFGLWLNKKKE